MNSIKKIVATIALVASILTGFAVNANAGSVDVAVHHVHH